MEKSTKRRALGPGGVRRTGVRSGEAGSAAVSPEQRQSVASGASSPGSSAGGGGGAWGPVSDAGAAGPRIWPTSVGPAVLGLGSEATLGAGPALA